MIRIKSEKSENKLEFSGKRHLQVDDNEAIDIPAKRISLLKRLQDISSERQEHSSKVVVANWIYREIIRAYKGSSWNDGQFYSENNKFYTTPIGFFG